MLLCLVEMGVFEAVLSLLRRDPWILWYAGDMYHIIPYIKTKSDQAHVKT